MWTISQWLRTSFSGDGSQVQTRGGGSAPAGRNKDQDPGGSGNEGRVSDSPPPGQMRTNDSSLSRLEGLTLTLRRVSFRVMATILRGAELALFSNPPPGGLLLRVDLLFQAEGFFQTFLFRLFWSSSSS